MRRFLQPALVVVLTILTAGIFLKGTIPQPAIGNWLAAGAMTAPRSGAASALLQDGRILITGGDNGAGPVASAEVLDTTGSFVAIAPMGTARSAHSATVLTDGRVLVAGGSMGSAATNAAEIFDPAANPANAWTPVAGGMIQARSNHTASLLADGRVLFAGGDNAGVPTASLEIFDPVANSFSSVGAMASARTSFASAILSNGRVMLIGGTNGSAPVASTEIFDPTTNLVAVGPALSAPRMAHSATTLLDGRVLVAGGTTLITNPDGSTSNTDVASAEIYDPATGSFSVSASSLAAPRRDHAAFLLPNNNSVLIVGGTSTGAEVGTAELFLPSTGTFVGTGSPSVARQHATGSALSQDGILFLAGGSNSTGALATTELYGFATVKTDKSDYAPGSIVTITGSGWQPGETVTLTLVESPLFDTHPVLTAIADSTGKIVNTDFSPDVHDINIRFYLTAIGSVSGIQAQNTFTDASSSTTTISCAPNPVAVNTVTTCTASVKGSGAGQGNPDPSGTVTFSWNGNTTLFSAASGSTFTAPNKCTLNLGAGGSNTSTCSVRYTPNTVGSGTQTLAANYSGDTNYPAGLPGNTSLIVSGSPLTLSVTGFPTTIAAGTAGTFTVTAKDSNNNVAVSYIATVNFTSSDGAASLPANYTFTAADSGSHTFTNGATLRTLGTQSITATDSVTASITGAQSGIAVTAGTQSKLGFSVQPTNTNSNSNISPSVAVQVQDSFGNPVAQSGRSITLAIGTNPAGGTLVCGTNPVLTNATGLATFPNCHINNVGTGYTLIASASGNPTLTGATSIQFNIVSPITKLGFTTVAVSGAINQCLGPITVQTQNSGGTGVNPSSVVQVDLSIISGGTGGFFSNNTCTSATTSVNIPTTGNSADFFFKGTSAGSPIIQAADHAAVLTSATQSETVTKITPTFTVPASQSITYGTAAITLSGSIGAGSFFPPTTETVSVTINNIATPAAIGANGAFSATVSTSAIPASATAYTITYTYAGDTNFNGATNTATTLTVNKAATTTTVGTITPEPSNINQLYSVAWTVTVNPPGGGTPTGTVTVDDGNSNACTAPVAAGSCSLASTSSGTKTITATYSGDSNFTGSAGTKSHAVNNPATTTMVSSSLNPSVFGQPVTFTATVTSAGGTPTGNVTFYDSATCSGTILAGPSSLDVNGKAAFSTSTLNAASHTITACYTPTGIYLASSGSVTQTVNQAQATLSFDNLTFTYDGSPKPVSVTTSPANLTGVTILYNGSATPPTNPGSTPVSASLMNANYTATPISGTELILQASTITSDATTTFTAGAAGTFNVTTMGFPTASLMETGTLPSGVSFTDNLNGTATLAGTATVAGSYPITIAASNGVGSPAMQAFTLVVTAGDFTKLQLLVPGETAAPGTASGKTGTPNTEYVNGAFNVIVNAVDANWNVVSSVTDTVNIASTDTDPNVKLPANAALVAGTGTLSVTLQTVSYNPAITTLTASDVTNSGKTASTSPAIEVIIVYTAGIAPTMVATGDSVAYTLTVNNAAAPNTNTLRSVTVAIPAEGGMPSLVAVTAANAGPIPANWTADLSLISSHLLRFTQNTVNDGVAPGGTISIQFTATATNTVNGTLAQNVWTTTAFSDAAFASALPLAGTEPTVSIGARPVITSADHTTNEFTYGAAGTFTITTTGFPTPSLTQSGSLPGGVTFTDKGDGTATLAGTPTAAGTFTLTITAHNGFGSDATQTPFTLTVNRATVTPSITADDKYYDGTTAATIHCTLSGVLSADTGNVTCSGTGSFTDANAGMGKAVTSSNLVLGGNASGNYTLSTNTATTSAKINAKPVTAKITASDKTYDGTNAATITACTIPGKVGSDDVACSVPAGNATFASANASPTAQTVTATGITLSGNTASNYTLGANTTASTTATINTAPLTITANDKSKTYGGTDPGFDVSYVGFVNNEGPSVLAGTAVFNFAGKPPTSYGPSTSVPTNAGIYAVRPSGLTSSNYAITFKGGTYTINQATPTVTVTDPMPTYDGGPHAATATAVGFDGHTAVSGSFNLTYDGSATAPADAKTSYIVVASFTSSDPNYTNATGNGTLTIKQAGSITTLTFEAGPYTYRGTAFTATAVATGAGPLNVPVSPVYSGDCTNVTIVNGCTATATYAGDTNHTGSADSKSITITKADPVVTATGGTLFVYDGNPHAGSGTATGVKGEPLTPVTVAYSISPAPGNLLTSAPVNAGSYLVAARYAGNNNYNQKQSAAVPLVINQAALTITASSGSMIYGGPVFPVSASYMGFAPGEGPSNLTPPASCGTSATSSSPVGTYPSACIGAVDSNYSFNYVPGIVTVNPAVTTTAVFSSQNPSNWGQVVTLTATVTPQFSGTTPTGTVSFYNAPSGATTCQSVMPSALLETVGLATIGLNQQASTSTPMLPVGTDYILACYNGDSNFISSSGTLSQTVIPAPIANLSPASLSFGNQQAGTTSDGQMVTISNPTGTAPLNISSITITGTNPTYFTQTNSCTTVAAGSVSGCSITVKFAPPPNTTGVATAILVVTDNDKNVSGSTQSSLLTGAGTSSINSVGSLSTYALFATANGCSSLNMSGNATVDSFNSGASNNNGNVGTNGNATLSGNPVVNGAVYSPIGGTGNCSSKAVTGLSTSGKAQTGGLQALSGPLTYPAPSAPNPAPPTSTQSVAGSCGTVSGCMSNGTKSVILAPGQYGNLSVSGGTTVHVTMGTYNLNSLALSGNSTLVADAGGPVVFNIAGKSITGGNAVLDLSGGGVMSNASGTASNLQFYYAGFQPIKLSGGTGSYAVVYAPNAAINVSGGSHFYGNMIGSTINNSGGTAIHYDANLPNIAGGNYIWFNSAALNVQGLPASGSVKLYVTNASIAFPSTSSQCTGTFLSMQCTLPVPNAVITFSSTATSASTTWDAANNRWSTLVPTNGSTTLQTHAFLDGLAYLVPSGGFPAGIQNVTWSAAFSTSTPGIKFGWQWGAAVYSSLTNSYSSLGVNPVDGTDPAGTPENYKPNLIFGSTGPGFTGLYTGAAGVVPTIAEASASPSSLDFGLVNVNSPSTSMAATLTNNMSGALTINAVQITGANPGDFAQTNSCPISPGTLASGLSCTITVTFTPGATGKRTAKIAVTDSANNSPQTIFLKGTGQ